MRLTLMDKLHKLSRTEIENILTRYGFVVYDRETTEELRIALGVNINDHTIPESEVDACLS